MFGFKRKTEIPVREIESAVAIIDPETTAAHTGPSVPVPIESLHDEEELEALPEWLTLNLELGITQREPASYELRIFLREEGIRVYEAQAVWDYMCAQSPAWKFFPLRDRDCERYPVGSSKYMHAQIERWDSKVGNLGTQYDSAVPIPVLLTAKKLVEKFGNDVYFLVAATSVDPFLAVVLRDSTMVFIERWDEPSFRG